LKLFSRTGAIAVDDPEFGHFEPEEDGGFALPDPLFDRLHNSAVRGDRHWETAIERQNREAQAELNRRRDPAELLTAVGQLIALGQQAVQAQAPAEPVTKGRRGTKAEPKTEPADPENGPDNE
jgi:hypothetical protein